MCSIKQWLLCSAILLSSVDVRAFHTLTRCLFFVNKCVFFCPPNTHAYHLRCDREAMSQPTCDFPHVYHLGYTCGWSRCDCNGDLLLHEPTGKCYPEEDCPSSLIQRLKERRRLRKPYRQRKRIFYGDEDEDEIDRLKYT